jgi:integrase
LIWEVREMTATMRRKPGTGAVYLRKDGRWAGLVPVRDEEGRAVRKQFLGRSKESVEAKIEEFLRERVPTVEVSELETVPNREVGAEPERDLEPRLVHEQDLASASEPASEVAHVAEPRPGPGPEPEAAAERDIPLTLASYVSSWLEGSAKLCLSPRTYASYTEIMRMHVLPALGSIPLDQLSPMHVQDLLSRKLAEGLSPRTVQYIRAVLRSALTRAVKWEMATRNAAALAQGPRLDHHEVTPLSPERARALIAASDSERLGAMFVLALHTGLRLGELSGLRWADVDLEEGLLQVRFQLQRIEGTLQLVEPKTRRSRRTVYLSREAVASLAGHRERQSGEREQAGAGPWEHDLVFTNANGSPLDKKHVHRGFMKVLKRAGLPKMRFHDLRHTCASLLLAQNVHPKVVQELLGHSQISVTLDIYSHVMPTARRQAADVLDDVLRAAQ